MLSNDHGQLASTQRLKTFLKVELLHKYMLRLVDITNDNHYYLHQD